MIEYQSCISTPFGCIAILTHRDCVERVDFFALKIRPGLSSNTFSKEAKKQVCAYLRNPRFQFDLPIRTQGSEFRNGVWSQIAQIPFGTTSTYGDIARTLNSSARAVGAACGDNLTPILIPCHRVVSQSGLGGFMHSIDGFAMRVKRWLLNHEGITS
jgi:methylated-DNA-[protein]-cysteine S-methyltransferase